MVRDGVHHGAAEDESVEEGTSRHAGGVRFGFQMHVGSLAEIVRRVVCVRAYLLGDEPFTKSGWGWVGWDGMGGGTEAHHLVWGSDGLHIWSLADILSLPHFG